MNASDRGRLVWRICELIEEHGDELAMLESLDNGKPYSVARAADVPLAADLFRYMGGLADEDRGLDGADLGTAHAWGAPRVHAARAGRCGRTDHPVELPAADGGVEARPGARVRVHRRAQARGADAAIGAAGPRPR